MHKYQTSEVHNFCNGQSFDYPSKTLKFLATSLIVRHVDKINSAPRAKLSVLYIFFLSDRPLFVFAIYTLQLPLTCQ